MHQARSILIESFRRAVAAAHPDQMLAAHLPPAPRGDLIIVGAGKASAAMAAAVERHWRGTRAPRGLVLTRHGHGATTRHIKIVEAGHPLPDSSGIVACERMIDIIASARAEDHVLALVSGGGSSLLTYPEPGIELDDLRALSQDLLRSGAPIADINLVRKRLSRMLGGKLASRCRAPTTVLIISDVVGDDPSIIASGPFHPDTGTHTDALRVLDRWDIHAPETIARFLAIKPPSSDMTRQRSMVTCIIANADTALLGAREYFEGIDIEVCILGSDFQDEARTLGAEHARLAIRLARDPSRRKCPLALLSGGETCVHVRGNGRGGRNSEYLLAMVAELRGHPNIYALAADTDGIDGTEDNAGAVTTPETWVRALRLSLDAGSCLRQNDAYGYFAAVDGLLVTGPTLTNVNDYRAILIA
jgi:hydroxypyruvate reductase